ncbi:RING-type domain-containing protein [Abeliophyllum distichum]|uniref:RING-type E3 ubiquitin transferase n=1 Tax=Abeliophyllum distichum TaxID=126358 RepID=A0ABD1RR70_9LAMI
MKQSMNLSSSPFMAEFYNYTFYTCPVDSYPVGYNVLQIGCLSNSTNSTVATTEEAQKEIESFGCKNIGSLLLPITHHGQYEFFGINTDLSLTWNASDCKDCDPQPAPQDTGRDLS